MLNIIPILIMVAIYGSTNFYICMKLIRCLKYLIPAVNPVVIGILYGICALPTILSYLIGSLPDTGIKRLIGVAGSYWMGMFFYLLLFFLFSDLVLLILKLFKVFPSPVPVNIKAIASCLAIVLTVTLFTYGAYHARQIKNASYALTIHKSTGLKQLKIALISDLHWGYVYGAEHLEKVVSAVNQLEPDLICISGDLFDNNYNTVSDLDAIRTQLNRFSSTYGTYACLGNHDAGDTFDKMKAFLASANVTVLHDEYVSIDGQFLLAGRKDSSPIGKHGEARQAIRDYDAMDPTLPIIVMDHQPSNYPEYADEVDLILSGHTHQGQIFPLNLITNAVHIQDYGFYQKGENSPYMIVTSGAGTWGPPLRIGTNSEVAEITIQFQA